VNGGAARFVGIDLGGTAIKAGATDDQGRILEQRSIDLPRVEPGGGPEPILDAIARLGRELGVRDRIGIGVPGLLEGESGFVVESPNVPGFRALAVPREIGTRLGIDPRHVHVANDANVAALGEQWLGAARNESDLMFVTLGTGIGGGLILGGRLYAGTGMAGEVGHLITDPEGIVCGCGKRGCLETQASASAARRRATEAGLPAEDPGNLKLLAEKARSGSAEEAGLLYSVGLDLGRGLGPVISLLDLRCFVFGGGFSAALDTMETGIRAGIEERCFGSRADKVRLLAATLGPSAGWIGAAGLCRDPQS